MKRYRIKPNIDTEKNRESLIGGVFLAGVSWFIGLSFCIYYLLHRLATDDIGVALLCFCLTPVLIFQGGMGLKLVLEGISGLTQKKHWLKRALIGQAVITDRKDQYYDPGYDKDAHYVYELALKLDTIQGHSEFDEQFVWAGVSKRVFTQYVHRDTARIYYSLASPLNFLIEGE